MSAAVWSAVVYFVPRATSVWRASTTAVRPARVWRPKAATAAYSKEAKPALAYLRQAG